jgi:hypothetical protein
MTAHTPHANDVLDPEILGASVDENHPRPSLLFSSVSPSAADDSDERRAATQDRI